MEKRKDETADDLMQDLSDKICLLHLVAMGELNTTATVKDAVRYFWSVKENCSNCPYNQNCLCCLYTSTTEG